MALAASFDITSTVDLQEVDSAVNQARMEESPIALYSCKRE